MKSHYSYALPASLVKVGFTWVWQLEIEGSHLCRKIEIHIPDITQKSVIFSRSFTDPLASQPLVVIRSIHVTTKVHAYKFAPLRGKIAFFFLYHINWSLHHTGQWNKRKCLHKNISNSHRIGLLHQHGRCLIVLEHQYSCHDIMCMRSIQPLLLKAKILYAEMICYNGKYTFHF